MCDMAGKAKFQTFEMQTVNRKDIKGAPYNPRIIDSDAKKRLKEGLRKHGLVQPVVMNKRTGNLVGGHQRLTQLDSLMKGKDYDLDVAVIDVDEREEAEINVQLNNPSMGGGLGLRQAGSTRRGLRFHVRRVGVLRA